MFYTRQIREYPVQMRRPFARQFFNTLSQYGMPAVQTPYQTASWGWNLHTASPATDVLELDDQYILEIALPGVTLDDIELKVEENVITCIAKRTPNMLEERACMLNKEMPCGYLVRHFEFEGEIVHEQIEARLDRGILFVSVPKLEAAFRVPVSAGSIESHLPGMKTRVTGKSEVIRSGKEITVK